MRPKSLSSIHSGGKELDERSGVDGEGVLRGKHQVQKAGDQGATPVFAYIFKGHFCHCIFPKGIAAVIYFQRALLPSYTSKGHYCRHIFPKGISALIYISNGPCCHYSIPEGTADILHFQRALLPSYFSKGHCCHHIWALLPSHISVGQCCLHTMSYSMWQALRTGNWRTLCCICCCMNLICFHITTIQ